MRKDGNERLTVTIDQELLHWLQIYCIEHRMTKSEIITSFVESLREEVEQNGSN